MTFIIAGHMRSGTTILREVCQSHPDLEVTREFGNFLPLDAPFPAYARFLLIRWWRKRGRIAPLRHFTGHIRRQARLRNLPYVIRYLAWIYRFQHGRVTGDVIDRALRRLHPEAIQIGDKMPDYAEKLDQLTGDAAIRCIFIYRDPRDVAASTVEKTRGPWRRGHSDELRDPRRIALRWVRMMEAMERCRDRLLVIRYEDFVADPAPALARVAAWLEVAPDGFDPSAVHPQSIGRYRQGLTAQEIADVVEAAGPTMRRYGYAPDD